MRRSCHERLPRPSAAVGSDGRGADRESERWTRCRTETASLEIHPHQPNEKEEIFVSIESNEMRNDSVLDAEEMHSDSPLKPCPRLMRVN